MKPFTHYLTQFFIVCTCLSIATSCKPPQVAKVEDDVPATEDKTETNPEKVKVKQAQKTQNELPATLPVDRTITDQKGRTIDVTITAKTATEIQFRRKSDNAIYTSQITSLSPEDQVFLGRIENSDSTFGNERIAETLNENRIKGIQAEIDQIDVELKRLQTLIQGNKTGGVVSPRVRGYERDVRKLRTERAELEASLLEFR